MGDPFIRAVAIAMFAWCAGAGASPSSSPRLDACFDKHAARFGLDPQLLRSIAGVESGMRAEAENRTHFSRTGTRDIGIMQINSGWLPALARYGIGESELKEPCTNIEVGAWILSDLVSRLGDSWNAVGAYNAACTELKAADCRRARAHYAWKVWRLQQEPHRPSGYDAAWRVTGAAPRPSTGLVSASALQIGRPTPDGLPFDARRAGNAMGQP